MKYLPYILLLLAGVAIGSLGAVGYYRHHPAPAAPASPIATPTPEARSSSTPLAEQGVRIEQPLPGALVESPLTVSGTAPGNWFFEAQLPVCLIDSAGKEMACGTARALADWMTAGPVPFSASLRFSASAAPTGTVVIKNDNPSGNPANARSVSLPVRFR